MTIRHLRIFKAICEEGTATAAGERLCIAQPAVSLAIAELESYYEVKLFDRIGKRLLITEQGEELFQYAKHIIDLTDEIEVVLKQSKESNRVRIGASITIGRCLLPGYIRQMKKEYPDTNLEVVIDNSGKIEDFIIENKIDVGLIEGKPVHPYITTQCLKEDNFVFICSKNHPFAKESEINVRRLNGQNILLREKGSAGRQKFDALKEMYELNVHEIWESTSTEAIINGVIEGIGISILPYVLIKEAMDANKVSMFTLKNIKLKHWFSIISHKNKYQLDRVKDFINLCKESEEL